MLYALRALDIFIKTIDYLRVICYNTTIKYLVWFRAEQSLS